MMTFYRLAWLAVILLTAPYWLVRMLLQPKFRLNLSQRLGIVPDKVKAAATGRRVVWLHAVSVGETLAASRLVKELEDAVPGLVVLVSTTTDTGQRLAKELFGENRVCYFPLDFGFAIRRHLQALKPELMILIESEMWPGHLAECRRFGIPVVIANARISDRSFPRYMRLRFLWKRVFGGIALFLAQTSEDARRLRAIGAEPPQVKVSGNLKYDIRATAQTNLTKLLKQHLPGDSPVLVAGSTLAGEEEALINCWKQIGDAIMILAVRHPERFEATASLLQQSQLRWQRISDWRKNPQPVPPGSILLLDSIGELASIYSLARIAFVGGSLFGAGGHNPLEPAQWGVPVLQGESYHNFRAPVDALLAADAIRLTTPSQLCSAINTLLFDSDQALQIGARALEVFESQAGATARTVNAVIGLLQERNS